MNKLKQSNRVQRSDILPLETASQEARRVLKLATEFWDYHLHDTGYNHVQNYDKYCHKYVHNSLQWFQIIIQRIQQL